MKRLGLILAGGRATRFGGDKAAAVIDGVAMIDHVIAGLAPQVDAIAISGKTWCDYPALDDGDHVGEGPLAGLLAGIRYAGDNDFDEVLSTSCDTLPVPDFAALAGDGSAVIDGQWLLGRWPAALAEQLTCYLEQTADRSMRGWIAHCGARKLPASAPLYNLNTRDAMQRFAAIRESGA